MSCKYCATQTDRERERERGRERERERESENGMEEDRKSVNCRNSGVAGCGRNGQLT